MNVRPRDEVRLAEKKTSGLQGTIVRSGGDWWPGGGPVGWLRLAIYGRLSICYFIRDEPLERARKREAHPNPRDVVCPTPPPPLWNK